jgi:hypothetical protein
MGNRALETEEGQSILAAHDYLFSLAPSQFHLSYFSCPFFDGNLYWHAETSFI